MGCCVCVSRSGSPDFAASSGHAEHEAEEEEASEHPSGTREPVPGQNLGGSPGGSEGGCQREVYCPAHAEAGRPRLN